jgi:hypothetical protein
MDSDDEQFANGEGGEALELDGDYDSEEQQDDDDEVYEEPAKAQE